MKYLLSIILVTQVFAIHPKDRWDSQNNPARMGIDYITRTYQYTDKYEDLPIEGRLDKTPWSGDYWPTFKGGLSYRWYSSEYIPDTEKYGYAKLSKEELFSLSPEKLKELSPAEKYDAFIGNYDFPFVEYERQRTNILRTVPSNDLYDPAFEIPSWEGLCHGWAPATLLFDNVKEISIKNHDGLEVHFGASDLKALLTFHMHYNSKNVRNYFLGKRCNVDFGKLANDFDNGEISEEEYIRELKRSECLDVNAGAFHIVVSNQIGIMKEGFIGDLTRDFEVWNQPIFGYRAFPSFEKEPTEKQKSYGVHRVVNIYMEMDYVVETMPHWLFQENLRSYNTAFYDYDIEIDINGKIIGGIWQSEERPDFLWKQEKPEFSGYFSKLKDLYDKARGE